ncbi:hypothetical protein [Nostoc sp. CMAA1605]|uniref:hypothetical protein n=1 Tax=Nostoc sp. CMAA1605 TaxID=2055159 RepID=UPI001F1B866B|nr:hypothetical protein [Nostoc sp. CMAA1605]
MKEILAFIDVKKQEFAHLPLLKLMQDTSISPIKRLAWSPCATPFIMGFGELNKYAFRDLTSNDPIQILINKHTEEDDHHWLWFLSDIEKLGFDCSSKFSDTVKFLWDEETQIPRWVIHQLFFHAWQSDPLHKLVMIEVLESTGNIVFTQAAKVAQELQLITGNKYLYFGGFHLAVETGHTTGTDNIETSLQSLELTPLQSQSALELADKIFSLITELVNALFQYAITHDEQLELKQISQINNTVSAA